MGPKVSTVQTAPSSPPELSLDAGALPHRFPFQFRYQIQGWDKVVMAAQDMEQVVLHAARRILIPKGIPHQSFHCPAFFRALLTNFHLPRILLRI